PLRELGKILENPLRVGMEDVRPILVDQDAIFIVAVVGVPADMVPLVDDQNSLPGLAGQPLGEHAARKSRPDDQIIKHLPPFCLSSSARLPPSRMLASFY